MWQFLLRWLLEQLFLALGKLELRPKTLLLLLEQHQEHQTLLSFEAALTHSGQKNKQEEPNRYLDEFCGRVSEIREGGKEDKATDQVKGPQHGNTDGERYVSRGDEYVTAQEEHDVSTLLQSMSQL